MVQIYKKPQCHFKIVHRANDEKFINTRHQMTLLLLPCSYQRVTTFQVLKFPYSKFLYQPVLPSDSLCSCIRRLPITIQFFLATEPELKFKTHYFPQINCSLGFPWFFHDLLQISWHLLELFPSPWLFRFQNFQVTHVNKHHNSLDLAVFAASLSQPSANFFFVGLFSSLMCTCIKSKDFMTIECTCNAFLSQGTLQMYLTV